MGTNCFLWKKITVDVWFFHACCFSRLQLIAENRNTTFFKWVINFPFEAATLNPTFRFVWTRSLSYLWALVPVETFDVLFTCVHKSGGIITIWSWNNRLSTVCLHDTSKHLKLLWENKERVASVFSIAEAVWQHCYHFCEITQFVYFHKVNSLY